MERDQLEHLGSLITVKDTDECLGDLMYFEGHGTYDPSHGRVPVTKDEAEIHNKALDEARLDGMDRNCEVGQGAYAYYNGNGKVTSFVGTVISNDVSVNGRSLTFKRSGKVYRGRLRKESDNFNFRRVA